MMPSRVRQCDRCHNGLLLITGTATPEFQPRVNQPDLSSNNFPEFIPRSFDVDSLVRKSLLPFSTFHAVIASNSRQKSCTALISS